MINWSLVCVNLRHDYKPLARIAVEIGAGENHLNRLARGDVKEPKFSIGVKLLDLHYDYCRNKHEGIVYEPTVSQSPHHG